MLLSVPKFTATLYCICLSINLLYTKADGVQICGKFWDMATLNASTAGVASDYYYRNCVFFFRHEHLSPTTKAEGLNVENPS